MIGLWNNLQKYIIISRTNKDAKVDINKLQRIMSKFLPSEELNIIKISVTFYYLQ